MPYHPRRCKNTILIHGENIMLEHDRGALDNQVEIQSLLIDTVPVQMWFLSSADTYGRVNQAHADFLGKPKGDMEFRKLEEIFPPETAEICRLSNLDVLESGQPVNTAEWMADADGEHCLIDITKTPHFDGNGHIDYIVCYGIDITERRKKEKEVAQSESNFRHCMETIEDIILIADENGRIIYENPAALVKLGYDHEELRGKRIIDLHPDYVRTEAASILSDMLSGKRDMCPLPLIGKKGDLIPVETRIWHGVWDGKKCILGMSKDLTREQEALQKFDRFFRMNPAPMAVSLLHERTFVDVNEAFIEKLGYSKDEIIGKTSHELALFVDQDAQQHIGDLIREHGRVQNIELQLRTKQGTILWGLFSGDLIESQGDTYFLTVMIDVTKRKKIAHKLRQSNRQLKTLLSEIKTLRGVVPICAHCKKIRDDKGFWNQVEAYVSRHTEAEFSHGICPDCMKQLYPEYCQDKNTKRNG